MLQSNSHNEINRVKTFLNNAPFPIFFWICKIVRAEASLNNDPFSNCVQCSQCIAQCSVMNEYAEDLHGNDILDTETILTKIWIKMTVLKM